MFRVLSALFACTFLQFDALSAAHLGKRFDEKAAPAVGSSPDTTIREMLKRNYDRETRPKDVEVTFYYKPTCVVYDEQKGIVTTSAMAQFYWKDDRLSWNPRPVGDVKKIQISIWDIWNPDITCFNTINPWTASHGYSAHVTSDGYVIYYQMVNFETPCKDKHCKITLGSWMYNGNEMKLKVSDDNQGLDMTEYDANCPWTAKNAALQLENIVYPCCEEPYPTATITYDVERAS